MTLHLHKLWDIRTGQSVGTLRGHADEVLDVSFNFTGQSIASSSADSKHFDVGDAS